MKLTPAIILSLISFNLFAFDETRIPKTLDQGEFGSYIPEKHFNIFGLQFDSDTTLTEIIRGLGDSDVYKGEHTANHICYSNQSNVIEFTKSSLGYGYKVLKAKSFTRACSALMEPYNNLHGLRLGLTKEEIINLLGNPSSSENAKIYYTYWIQEKPSQEIIKKLKENNDLNSDIWLDVYSGVQLYFTDNQLTQFSVFTTETF